MSSTLALAFTTIERPHVAQRLVRSVRERFPEMPIYVADQSRHVDAMASFYAAMKVTLVRMPWDAGVCVSRNALVGCIQEDYFVLCDDDFLLGDDSDFGDAVTLLDRNADLGLIGGRLTDVAEGVAHVRRWELFLNYDPGNRMLTAIPLDHFAPVPRQTRGITFYLCDAVLNFSVWRRSIFREGISWDERFKSNGEHEDFFLNLKLHSNYRVGYLPTLHAYHHHPENFVRYRSSLRDRRDGWREFMWKWKIDQYLELDSGVMVVDRPGEVIPHTIARERFFLNSDVSLDRHKVRANVLEVHGGEPIRLLPMLDACGEPLTGGFDFARLLIGQQGRRELAVPGKPEAGLSGCKPSKAVPNFALDQSVADAEARRFSGQIFFRYDPICHDDSDFVVWYRGRHESGQAAKLHDQVPVIVRWFDRQGQVLVWESEPITLHGFDRDYWKPMLIEIPPFALEQAPVRFEIVEAKGVERVPLGAGFVTSQQPAAAGKALAHGGREVLAICHSRSAGGVTKACKGVAKVQAGVGQGRAWSLSSGHGLCLLEVAPEAAFEKLLLRGWNSIGREWICAELPDASYGKAVVMALPETRECNVNAQIFGWGSVGGAVLLRG